MLHFAISSREKAVREIPRINRCRQKAFGEGPGDQLGPGLRETDAEIQS
jgi:hypothetical protein